MVLQFARGERGSSALSLSLHKKMIELVFEASTSCKANPLSFILLIFVSFDDKMKSLLLVGKDERAKMFYSFSSILEWDLRA